MRIVDLIIKKRDGNELSCSEINYLIDGYVKGDIPDYQMSALLMAVYFVPLTEAETFHFTQAILKSGEEIDLSPIKGTKVDKHSTGGVGDKTSLVVAAIAAAAGVKMAKMSGRGLGHTGGTLDKLEAIPNFKIELSAEAFFKQVNEIGLAIIGQSNNITPADKKMYALRDVTATVESIGLIAASIMSKKLASGADYVVLDVKVGSGAFMKDLVNAKKLAHAMVTIGQNANRATVAMITDMEQPLGFAVGNALEDIEAIETLKGHGPTDFNELCYAIAGEILQLTKIVQTNEEAQQLIDQLINSGAALEKLRQMIKYQGGDERVIDDYTLFPAAKQQVDVLYNGPKCYVAHIDALKIGEAAMLLGAGRLTKDDKIDLAVGIVLNKKIGDVVRPNEPVATIHSNGLNTEISAEMVAKAYAYTSSEVAYRPIILDTIKV